jgi:putative effector of murein hydrolase
MRRPIHHQLSAPVTHAATKPNKIPWDVNTLLAAIGCILMTAYRYLDLAHGGAVLTYLLYPASIFSVALLLYTRDYIKYWEIRLLGVFFVWVLAVIAMNYWRASDAISSGWMHSLISISILCFSLPYALRDINPKAALRILAAVTILLTAVTGIVALYLVLTGNSIDFRPAIEGVLGMDDEGRLEFFQPPEHRRLRMRAVHSPLHRLVRRNEEDAGQSPPDSGRAGVLSRSGADGQPHGYHRDGARRGVRRLSALRRKALAQERQTDEGSLLRSDCALRGGRVLRRHDGRQTRL